MLNLLKNAVEAVADRPDPAVCLHCHETDDGTMIEIIDNGSGLPVDREALFRPFYTTKLGGSGIGLAVSRQIAQAHGGTLTARSEPQARGFP